MQISLGALCVLAGRANLPDRIAYSDAIPGASVQSIFVTSARPPSPTPPELRQDRNEAPRYLRYAVSVPPSHRSGQIEWPDGPVNPVTDFAVTDVTEFETRSDLLRALKQKPGDEVTLFVHGYNTTSSEALYRLAQIGFDFEIDTPLLLFSWPSAGRLTGYVYDRGSVLFSRDPLANLLTNVTRSTGKEVILLAHSMGAHLTMEVLRQLAITGREDVLDGLDVVVLLAPDIDPDVFRVQANAIGSLPDPFVVMTNRNDRALSLSPFLNFGRQKVGDLSRAKDVAGLDVTLFDFTALADGSSHDHLVPMTSPAAIAVLRDLVDSDRRGDPDLSSFEVGKDGVIRAKPQGIN